MATIEQLQGMLERPRVAPVQSATSLDLSEVVNSLKTIADELSRAASKPSTKSDPVVLNQSTEMLDAAQAIVRVLEPLSEAIKSIEIPAPVVNVEAPSVTVERLNAPRFADIVRDEDGYMKRIVFCDEYVDDDDDDDDDDGFDMD